MKKIKIILTALFFLIIQSTAQAQEIVYTLQVDGLSCPFCVYGIEKQLNAVDGVDSVIVDISKGLVSVTMQKDIHLDKERARQAVTDAGFTLRAFKQSIIDITDESIQ